MYSDRDMLEVNARIRKIRLALLPVLAVPAAAYVAGLVIRLRWLVTAAGVVLFAAAAFGLIQFLLPNLRYRRFLAEMREGLSREMAGSIVEISEKPEEQDGCRVLPVRILLTEEQDERIVYLNASKAGQFPAVGETVRLKLYGRHIREVETS